jgi:hypothetical protein
MMRRSIRSYGRIHSTRRLSLFAAQRAGCFRRHQQKRESFYLRRPRARTYKLYFEKYVKVDPLLIGEFLASIEEPVPIGDIMPCQELLENPCLPGMDPTAAAR